MEPALSLLSSVSAIDASKSPSNKRMSGCSLLSFLALSSTTRKAGSRDGSSRIASAVARMGLISARVSAVAPGCDVLGDEALKLLRFTLMFCTSETRSGERALAAAEAEAELFRAAGSVIVAEGTGIGRGSSVAAAGDDGARLNQR